MRLFVALIPPEELRRDLERQGQRLQALCGRGKMVPWENIHLTLAFLGETDRGSGVERAMKRAAGAPFSLRTTCFGRFPQKKGEIWWMGVEESAPLLALRRRLVQALGEEEVWLDDSRPFQPHLTLGRGLKPENGTDLVPQLFFSPSNTWHVEEVALMESRRDAGVLKYTPLVRLPLKENGDAWKNPL